MRVRLQRGDKKVTRPKLELKGDDRGACNLLGVVV
ncbi:hypothetical protein Tco_1096724, partial [Tanacetum coccineum]